MPVTVSFMVHFLRAASSSFRVRQMASCVGALGLMQATWASLGRKAACRLFRRGVGSNLGTLRCGLGVCERGGCIAVGGHGTAAGHCNWPTHVSWATRWSGRAASCSRHRPRRGARAGEMAGSSSWRARPRRICMMLARTCQALLLPPWPSNHASLSMGRMNSRGLRLRCMTHAGTFVGSTHVTHGQWHAGRPPPGS